MTSTTGYLRLNMISEILAYSTLTTISCAAIFLFLCGRIAYPETAVEISQGGVGKCRRRSPGEAAPPPPLFEFICEERRPGGGYTATVRLQSRR